MALLELKPFIDLSISEKLSSIENKIINSNGGRWQILNFEYTDSYWSGLVKRKTRKGITQLAICEQKLNKCSYHIIFPYYSEQENPQGSNYRHKQNLKNQYAEKIQQLRH